MCDYRPILESYLQKKLINRTALAIARLEKITDGWESENYLLTVEYGFDPRRRADWVWRIYSGTMSQAKAAREFFSMKRLFEVGYPVPQVYLLETEHSPVDRPFIILEYIQGDVMWNLLGKVPADRQVQLIDQFCRLFVQLHHLDWRPFDRNLPYDNPYFIIDRWLFEARRTIENFPEIDGAQFLEWVEKRRALLSCTRPSPVHHDFHPGNILIRADGSATVIDWTNFTVTDARFDLAWTLVLAHAYGWPELRAQIFQGYQLIAREQVEQFEIFEAIACARRLLDLTVSLTHGSERMGMNAQAAKAMRADMEAHRRVYRLFIERTGLNILAFGNLFGEPK